MWVVHEPPGGWSGTPTAAPATDVSTEDGSVQLALQDQTLFTAGGSAVGLFQVSQVVGPPVASRASLAGLANGKPRLSFKLFAADATAAIKSFAISLPGGLTFSNNHKQLTSGVSAAGARNYTVSLDRKELVVRLPKPSSDLSVTIRGHALSESMTLISSIKRLVKFNRAPQHHNKKVLTLRSACA